MEREKAESGGLEARQRPRKSAREGAEVVEGLCFVLGCFLFFN